jgi:pimeloyl-ACP methyl ester carboxylesterase
MLDRSTVVLGSVLVCVLAAGVARAALDPSQQACVNALNKDGAKVAATQGKENAACIKSAGKAKLASDQTAEGCLTADSKGKVAKAKGKTEADFAARCADSPPEFGVPAGSAAAVNGAAVAGSLDLLHDVFGADLDAAVAGCAEDSATCKCQQAISNGGEKVAATAFKEFLGCKRSVLSAGASSAADLAACIEDPGTPGSLAADSKGKVAKAVAKLGSDIAKKCDAAGVPSSAGAPGICSELIGSSLAACIGNRVACRVCLSLNAMDGLDADCDRFDDGTSNGSCGATIVAETTDIPSSAAPPNTPGTPGVQVSNAKLLTQFGGPGFNLNHARYTRFRADLDGGAPDAILVLVPGFEGGANNFKILAENLIPRVAAAFGLVVEVWAYDRRTNQLEDTLGLDMAEALGDAQVGLDWLFGGELGLSLSPALAAGPNRRAVFYDEHGDVPFIANWTPLVFSRDIDAVISAARDQAREQNVFLGGHSAGTGFAARYAATDFNLTGTGEPDPGYAKLRGLVLLEGAGGSVSQVPPSEDTLDRIEAKFDGGLFAAVRGNAGRCVDGVKACTIATEATACSGLRPPKCTLPTTAYAVVPGILNPRVLAAVEPAAIQGMTDPNSGQILLQVDQGSVGNNAVAKVPDLASLAFLPRSTVFGGIGSFVDDDGVVASLASFVATSVGAPGPVVNGLLTWIDITAGPMPASAVPNNGPPPTSLPAPVWGQEKEVTRLDRMLTTFFAGQSNFVDWYYPSSGLSTTSVSGVCTNNTCSAGNVGAACSQDADCSQSIGLDSSALSIGRGRRDIENLTQAANIDIPVVSFGASNGLVRAPGNFVPFAQSIGACAAPTCDGRPRVVDATNPNPAFPTFGDRGGGFEVYVSEGFAHVDVLLAEDRADNEVLGPLAAFLARNVR